MGSCSPNQTLSDQPAKSRVQIESWVPIGTSLADARQIMEQHNFTCAVMTNSSFGDLKKRRFPLL